MFADLALIVLAGMLGPILANTHRPLIPVVLGQLLGGVLIGRSGLALVDPASGPLPALSAIGFLLLMVTAGQHVDVGSPDLLESLVRGASTFAVVAVVAVPIGLALGAVSGLPIGGLLAVLLAGSSAAVVMPIIEEQGLTGPTILFLTGWITVADSITVVLMPLLLTGPSDLPAAILGDAAIVVVAAAFLALGLRARSAASAEVLVRRSRHRGWALQLRSSVLVLLVLAAIAEATGASQLVAGFATGIVLAWSARSDRLAVQLSGVANGLFVPLFFVLLGATLDLRALVGSPSAMALAVALAVAAVVVHLVASALRGEGHRLPMGLTASAQLGLPAAAASLGLASGSLSPAVAAALVAAGCLTLGPAVVGADLLARRLAPEPPNPARAAAIPSH